MDRSFWFALIAVMVVALGLRGYLLTRPLAALDGKSLPDDAYLSLEVARNIGMGRGPLYGDQFTNGFQPLYVWVVALIHAIARPPEHPDVAHLDTMAKWAVGVCVAFDLLTIPVLMSAIDRALKSRAAAFVVGAVWAVHPASLRVATNGLETSCAVFFFVLIWRLSMDIRLLDASPKRLWLLGLVCGLGGLARIDVLAVGLFFALESLVMLAKTTTRDGPSLKRWALANGSLLGGTTLAYAPWLIYSYVYTGLVYPVSGRAVRWISLTNAKFDPDKRLYFNMAKRGLKAIHYNLPQLEVVLAVAAGLGASLVAARLIVDRVRLRRADEPAEFEVDRALRDPSPWRWLGMPLLYSSTLFAAYTLYIFAPWFFKRYLFPLHVLAMLVLAIPIAELDRGLATRVRRLPAWGRAVLALVLAAGIGGHAAAHKRWKRLVLDPPSKTLGYRSFGLWARDNIEPATVVGCSQTGALAYYARQAYVVNLDGVVNQEAFAMIQAGLNIEYVRQRGITTVLGWRTNIRYLKRNSVNWKNSDLRYRGKVEGVKSWGSQWRIYDVRYPPGEHPSDRGDPQQSTSR